ncbi:MAG: hypothetical protein CL943_02145 [Candidatus Diapherotrites archaeon]|uniref:Glycosyltransferase 2-like domain-containing protein n=1 Tax=Candidatus Iainarchaeum sp. TaxID=3101447 RepID=A0A2D6M0X9_9ARCH|nr:hypothetical protein [Candidatus Diapherotrites archaeon]|tara:strand:- start:59 stop:760 length:702 start_codon:yes stop_codon:yes gene_type:complete
MVKPIVSIIVPTYNEEEFIEQTLKALLSQTVPKEKYEIIVSDSSSTDKTLSIAKKYADKVVVCKKHSAGFGRNFGAKQASTPLLGFVDADTIVESTWVEALIEGLEKAVACTGPIKSLERNSIILSMFFWWWGFQSWITTMLHYPIFPGYNIGARKKAFDQVGGFSTENITVEDIKLGLDLSKVGKVVFNDRMKVKTSNRRLNEIWLPSYIWNGVKFTLFGKSRGWEQHRKDF